MNKELPLVSIIVPYYNHNAFIRKCLDSVINDTYENKELLIINDGSTEGDSSNLDAWIAENGNRIPVKYSHRENRGLIRTLHELIEQSNGQYILILASDDFLINDTIARRVACLQANPSKLLCLSDAIVVDQNGRTVSESSMFDFRRGRKENYLRDGKLTYEIVRRWSVAGSVYMVDRKIFDVIGKYDPSLILEDWDFFLRAASENLIIYLDVQVSGYRAHDNNTFSNPGLRNKIFYHLYLSAKKNLRRFSFPLNAVLFGLAIVYKIRSHPYKP
ncbi:glycosyltransferase family 2 protein [Massilia alkalitolerans]|uniref:glycosyltransferase family 2 protein n=1 Tax=Massilia alkalitolerans TaxID=286638 RepID=UPI0028B197C8|nr:glycosyltransferase [Massilia alkalitolerans]